MTPVSKKGENVSILSNVSKVFERFMFREISNYMDYYLSKYQCGCRKICNTRNFLLYMLEEWKRTMDQGKVILIIA